MKSNLLLNMVAGKSRRDDTLLTVDFNLRNTNDVRAQESPEGTTLGSYIMYRPCGTFSMCPAFPVRRLKPTVNQVSSLRDFVADKSADCCFYYIYTPEPIQN